MNAPVAKRLRLPRAVAAATAAATAAALLLAPERPWLAVAPVVSVAAVWAAVRLPLRVPLLALLFLVLAVENPQDRPFDGLWQSPLQPLSTALYVNLRQFVGVEALRFSALDLSIGLLLAVHLYRRATGRRSLDAPAGSVAGASCVAPALLVGFAAVVAAEVWGIGRGGDFRNSLWQVRQLFFTPVLAYLFLVGLRGPQDFRRIGAVLLAAALVKALVGFGFYLFVVLPRGLAPQYLTSHTDSPLFVGATVLVIAHWYHSRTPASRRLLAAIAPLMLVAIVLNERRLAHLQFVCALGALYLLAPADRLRRSLHQIALLAAPLAALYLAVGWGAPGAAFAPVRAIRSLVDDTDSSAVARRVENENLIVTLRASAPLGTGFGHEYIEQARGDSIAAIFDQYRFIPHNAVLGLFAFAGPVGFAAIMAPVVVGLYLGARALRAARTRADRVAAQLGIALLICHLVQAWGDMGLTSWDGAFLAAAAIAGLGKLAPAVGAWPASAPASASAAAASSPAPELPPPPRGAAAPLAFAAPPSPPEVAP